MTKRHNNLRPYIRLANGKERCQSMVMGFRLAFFQSCDRPFYVMVQRGVPNLVMDVGRSKQDLQRKPLPVAMKRMRFRQWSKLIQQRANGQWECK